MRIRTRTLAFLALFAILTLALSAFSASGDAYHKQAIIGGGYGDATDGGAIISPSGDITTDGTVKADTRLHVPFSGDVAFGDAAQYRFESASPGTSLSLIDSSDVVQSTWTTSTKTLALWSTQSLITGNVAAKWEYAPASGTAAQLRLNPKAGGSGIAQRVQMFLESNAGQPSEFVVYSPGTATAKFTVDAPTGNTTIAGALGVTGASTMADAVLTKTISGAGQTLQVNYTPGTAGSGTLDSQALEAVLTPMDANDTGVERFAINAKILMPKTGYTIAGMDGMNVWLDMSAAARAGTLTATNLLRLTVGDNTFGGGTTYGTVNVLQGIALNKLTEGAQYNSGIFLDPIGNNTALANYGITISEVGGTSSLLTHGMSIGTVTGAAGSTVYGINVGNVSGGANNYAIKTGTGAVSFGDTCTATQFRLSALNAAPTNASATGTLGEVRITDGHIYVCTATNTWKRAALVSW